MRAPHQPAHAAYAWYLTVSQNTFQAKLIDGTKLRKIASAGILENRKKKQHEINGGKLRKIVKILVHKEN